MSYYPGRITEHFLLPRNVGDLTPADTSAETGSLTCGAVLRLSLAVDGEARKITDAKFKAAGCGYLIASASMMTEIILGRTTADAAAVAEKFQDEARRYFGELPPDKRHCAALCGEALLEAIAYYSQSVRDEWSGDEALICTCFGVPERRIEQVVREKNLRTVAQVTRACNAGGGCHSCHPLIEQILEHCGRDVRHGLKAEMSADD